MYKYTHKYKTHSLELNGAIGLRLLKLHPSFVFKYSLLYRINQEFKQTCNAVLELPK